MRFTKLGHSCVRLEKNGTVLAVDPGGFSDAAAALDGAAAVLVTHEHVDHLDADAIRAALSTDPDLTLWANQAICAQFSDFGDRTHEVKHGDALAVAGFDVLREPDRVREGNERVVRPRLNDGRESFLTGCGKRDGESRQGTKNLKPFRKLKPYLNAPRRLVSSARGLA